MTTSKLSSSNGNAQASPTLNVVRSSSPVQRESSPAATQNEGVKSMPVTEQPYTSASVLAAPPRPLPMSSTDVSASTPMASASARVALRPRMWNSSTGAKSAV